MTARSYKLPGVRRVLRTTAERRYLVVSVYDGRPRVETSCMDRLDAEAKARDYTRQFAPGSDIRVLDTDAMTPR